MTNHGVNQFNESEFSTAVSAKIYPENATYRDIHFQAVNLNGVTSNVSTIDVHKETNTAKITAVGDGQFRLCCTCNNGLDHVEVISELEFEASGLGKAAQKPYQLLPASSYAASSDDGLSLSFQGGVYITGNERTTITFQHVDFGDYGSDEIHLPDFLFQRQPAN